MKLLRALLHVGLLAGCDGGSDPGAKGPPATDDGTDSSEALIGTPGDNVVYARGQ